MYILKTLRGTQIIQVADPNPESGVSETWVHPRNVIWSGSWFSNLDSGGFPIMFRQDHDCQLPAHRHRQKRTRAVPEAGSPVVPTAQSPPNVTHRIECWVVGSNHFGVPDLERISSLAMSTWKYLRIGGKNGQEPPTIVVKGLSQKPINWNPIFCCKVGAPPTIISWCIPPWPSWLFYLPQILVNQVTSQLSYLGGPHLVVKGPPFGWITNPLRGPGLRCPWLRQCFSRWGSPWLGLQAEGSSMIFTSYFQVSNYFSFCWGDYSNI